MSTWELRLYGVDPRDPRRVRAQRVYRIAAVSYTDASERAKSKARADGLHAPCVWAATKLPDYPGGDKETET